MKFLIEEKLKTIIFKLKLPLKLYGIIDQNFVYTDAYARLISLKVYYKRVKYTIVNYKLFIIHLKRGSNKMTYFKNNT